MREDCQRGAGGGSSKCLWTRDWRLLSCQIPRLMEEFAKSPPENVLSILLPRLVDDERRRGAGSNLYRRRSNQYY